MTNDEAPNDERMTKVRMTKVLFFSPIRDSDFVILSTFDIGIRHSSPRLRAMQ